MDRAGAAAISDVALAESIHQGHTACENVTSGGKPAIGRRCEIPKALGLHEASGRLAHIADEIRGALE
jgi:hypothetical protein